MHHGFTEYTFCAPTTLKAAYGHVCTPSDSEFCCHWVVATLRFLSYVCIMVSWSPHFVSCPQWNLRPSVPGVIITPCHLSHVRFKISHNTRLCHYPYLSVGPISVGSSPHPASNLISASWFHIAGDSARIPRKAKADLALPLSPNSRTERESSWSVSAACGPKRQAGSGLAPLHAEDCFWCDPECQI